MAEPAGMPNCSESRRGVWSVATVTSGTPPCAGAGELRSSAKPLATRHMQIILHAEVCRFWNRDECGDGCLCMGTPSPKVKIRGSEHGYYLITLVYERTFKSREAYHGAKYVPIR